jgi:AsmA protein
MNSDVKTWASRVPRWAWICSGVVVLLLLIGLIAPLFINVDKFRPRIAAAIEAQTGRKVTLGTIHARLLPSAHVIVDGFTISNPKDFADGQLLTADQIRGGLTLTALLGGDIHVTSLKLVRPRLVLSQDELGRTNYTFPSQSGAASAGGAAGTSVGNSGGFTLESIDKISLVDADVSLQQIPKHGAQPFVIVGAHKINVKLENVLLDANAIKQWSASADLSGISVEIGALAAPAEFKSGDVKLENGTVNANFRVQVGKIADVKGTLHVTDVAKAETVFELSTPEIDAGALLASIRKTPELKSSPDAAVPIAKPDATSDALLAQGKITAEKVVWPPYTAGNASAEIHIYGDRMVLMPATMYLYGGTLQVSARTDSRQDPERYSANLQLRNLDVGRMLASAPGGMKGKMTGFADFDMQLLGSSGADWQKAITGDGNFSIRDGKLPGVNLAGALGALAKAAGINETSYKRISGDLNVANGRVSTKETRMDSSSGMVELSGGVALSDQAMSFDGKATLGGTAAVPAEIISSLLSAASNKNVSGGITVPFAIGGTLSEPKFMPGKGIPGIAKTGDSKSKDPVQAGIQSLFKKKH